MLDFRYKKALVTGAGGFIGSHLTEALLEQGVEVRALVHYNSLNSFGWLEGIANNPCLEIVSGDVRDYSFISGIMKDVDVVFHLAALIAIPYSYIAPESYIDTNVKGTLNICKAALELGNIRTIVTSTSEVYGTAQYVPITENHPKQPQSPYSASKIAADALALSFFHSFNAQVSIVRPFNTYGPRQSARAVIPSIISQIASGKTKISIGDLNPTRDLNFVSDTCRGIILVSKSSHTIGKEVNVCSRTEISIKDLFNTICKEMGREAQPVFEATRLRPATSEVYRLFGDNALIKELVGYEPEYTLEKGLAITCDWFSQNANLKLYKTRIYNI